MSNLDELFDGCYVKSMGKFFKVRKIAINDDEANAFCATHHDTGVIACDRHSGLVFIADIYSSPCRSDCID